MHSNPKLDELRNHALARFEKKEQQMRIFIIVAALLEGIGLVAYLMLADFSDRTHVLILLAAVMVYSILAFGLMALSGYIGDCTHRVLKALELQNQHKA